jgi:hypothetical protein
MWRRMMMAVACLTMVVAPVARAQKLVDLTVEILDRLLRGYDAEKSETDKVRPQLDDVDAKLKKFLQCKRDWELAATASGRAISGLAARLAIRTQCGASSEDDIVKDRQKILDGPENAGAKAGGFKLAEYTSLRDKVMGYLRGDRSGFTQGALDLLASRASDLSGAFGIALATTGSAPAAMPGMAMAGMWTMDYTWAFIAQLFALQYVSGATMFEKPYTPGQWTRWDISQSDNTDEHQTLERAFLFATPDSSEWWRLKTITTHKDGNKDVADTVTLEAQFKPMGDQVKQLVRMRGKLPGNPDPQEMIVPQAMSMVSLAGMFPFRPTPESIAGATVGTESLTTAAGTFSAQHVRFGAASGTVDWWLDDTAPGAWVKFAAFGNDKKETWHMEMIGKGDGATSELGVKM